MVYDNGLIRARLRSGSIDDPHVLENDNRRVHRDEGLNTRREAALGAERGSQEGAACKLGFHLTDYLKISVG
jgi:hypothetical protein